MSVDAGVVVWDLPLPVAAGQPFRFKLGAPDQPGAAIEVRDAAGEVVARARLSDTPYPGTAALSWAEIELIAPDRIGIVEWEVVASGSSRTIVVETAPAPEHTLTIMAFDGEHPVEGVELRVGRYRATTDEEGVARLALPRGAYDIAVWKVGYSAAPIVIDVAGDVRVPVDLRPVPKAHEPYWM